MRATHVVEQPMTDLFCASAAELSPCGRYRYSLSRSWEGGAGRVLWVMLNPSTADAEKNDPTIRRCIAFSRLWHFNGLEVVNLYAYRSPQPADLADVADPIGPENDAAIERAARRTDGIVVAWGHLEPTSAAPSPARAREVLERLRLKRQSVYCLGVTKTSRQPRHPLYVKGETALMGYQAAAPAPGAIA